MIIQTKVQCS